MKFYVIAALIALMAGSFLAAYQAGKTACKAEIQQAVIEHKQKEDELLLALDKAKKERSIVYRDRTKIIEAASDSCLDLNIPDSIERLLNN